MIYNNSYIHILRLQSLTYKKNVAFTKKKIIKEYIIS